ncbi:YqaA family protein [Hydrogenophaga sp.]|uniref:YqaA family protein n=1 Tax=Hydrogenophaga sp. TaxID=1904254 RepID=UPI001ACF7A81|nr:YqaA family protein [Hydrogenophaga sp.]MBN9369448.1 DedA family protein [Hydrogenophaga sp.]
MIGDWGAYSGLFLSAFVAATLLPTASEAVLVGLLLGAKHPVEALLLVATVGNVLGAVLNWVLGLWIERFRGRPWFPVKPQALERAQSWYQRYGKWSLLLSWAPVIGDPLTVVAGVMREPFPVFLLLVTIAKFGRYAVLTLLTLGLS